MDLEGLVDTIWWYGKVRSSQSRLLRRVRASLPFPPLTRALFLAFEILNPALTLSCIFPTPKFRKELVKALFLSNENSSECSPTSLLVRCRFTWRYLLLKLPTSERVSTSVRPNEMNGLREGRAGGYERVASVDVFVGSSKKSPLLASL